ncbi:MAG: hypothetical protein ACPIOQ_43775, partial [Promethearchaeia archaeon]
VRSSTLPRGSTIANDTRDHRGYHWTSTQPLPQAACVAGLCSSCACCSTQLIEPFPDASRWRGKEGSLSLKNSENKG